MNAKILALVAACGVLLVACGTASPPNSLRADLAAVRANGAGAEIDLAQSVQGDWDTVVVLKPYSSTTEVDSALGFTWRANKQRIIGQSDSHNLLVFVRDGRVRYAELLERSAGDFCCFERNGRYSRARATFAVEFESRWMRLRHVVAPAG